MVIANNSGSMEDVHFQEPNGLAEWGNFDLHKVILNTFRYSLDHSLLLSFCLILISTFFFFCKILVFS